MSLPLGRIDIGALRHIDQRDWGGSNTFVIERRSGQGWLEVARFHDPTLAAGWVDEAVARGEGELEDYALLVIAGTFGARHPWARWALLAGVAIAVLFLMAFVLLPR